MSYLVLARKWRPQVFEEVIGQESTTRTLQNAIAQKRVAHAFLFAGPRGVGKTSTARILAKALNCEKGPQINPCNQCSTCQEISSGTSMDVIEIDGASNRGIDEIRELRESVRYTPVKNRYKIIIIDEVHMLTREAFNALLKTLEEPPSHVLFIFATTEPHKIPPTILSRCQRYNFKRIPLKEIAASLKRIAEAEGVEISANGLFSIAKASEGSMRDAQSLFDQVISYAGKEIRDEAIVEALGQVDLRVLYETVDAISRRDPGRCLEIVEAIYHEGYDLDHFCQELLEHFRNLILMKVSKRPEALIDLPAEELDSLRDQASRFELEQLDHLFHLLLKGEKEVVQAAFPRIMLEMVLVRMATLRSMIPIEEILKKLEGPGKEKEPLLLAQRKELRAEPIPTQTGREPERVPLRKSMSQSDDQQGEIPEENALEMESEKEPFALANREGPVRRTEFEEKSAGRPENRPEGQEFERSGEPPATPSSEEGDESALRTTWQELVDFTRARKPVLGAFLALGALVGLSDTRIEIGFEKGSFHYDRMVEKENRIQLEQICADFFKREMKVVVKAVDEEEKGKGRGHGEKRIRVSSDQERLPRKAPDKEPLVQEILRLFEGRIVES